VRAREPAGERTWADARRAAVVLGAASGHLRDVDGADERAGDEVVRAVEWFSLPGIGPRSESE
jgi:hypothetical protein